MTTVIKGFENYTISTSGEVVSLKRRHQRWGTIMEKPKIMVLSKTGKYRNYLTVRLTNLEGKSKACKVHRLVAEAFLPNPDNKPQVNHIDGNTLNNKVDNLEWCDNSQNQLHAYKIGLKRRLNGCLNHRYGKEGFYKDKRGDEHPTSIRVIKLTLNDEVISGYESATLGAESVGKCSGGSSNILKACRGETKKSYGFKWCFPTEQHKYLFKEYVNDL